MAAEVASTLEQAVLSAIGGSPVALVLLYAYIDSRRSHMKDVDRLEAAQKESTAATHEVAQEIAAARRDVAEIPDRIVARLPAGR